MQRTSIETTLHLLLETIATHHPALAQQLVARFQQAAEQSHDKALAEDLQKVADRLRGA